MMIAIGSDHGGVELKDYLIGFLRSKDVDVRDCGTHGRESVDYPDFSRDVSVRVAQGEAERGILICTSGIGMSIAANTTRPVFWLLVGPLPLSIGYTLSAFLKQGFRRRVICKTKRRLGALDNASVN